MRVSKCIVGIGGVVGMGVLLVGEVRATPVQVLESSWEVRSVGEVQVSLGINRWDEPPYELRRMSWDIERRSDRPGDSVGLERILLPSGEMGVTSLGVGVYFDEWSRSLRVGWGINTYVVLSGPDGHPNQYAWFQQGITMRTRFRLSEPMVLESGLANWDLTGRGWDGDIPAYSCSLSNELPAGEHEVVVDFGFGGSWSLSQIPFRDYYGSYFGWLSFVPVGGASIPDTGSSLAMLVVGAGLARGLRRTMGPGV